MYGPSFHAPAAAYTVVGATRLEDGMKKVRRWLHYHGIHQFCRVERIVERTLPAINEFIRGSEGDIDVSDHSLPRRIYRTVHR